MEPYSVKLDSFEGPLDLLLHLIQEAEVDIYDISVAELTEQYLAYVSSMQQLELDIASEYLVMAATLLHIKSKTLLPVQEEMLEEEIWEEEVDLREQLIDQLVEYQKYKEAAANLKKKEAKQTLVQMRPATDLSSFVTEEERQEVALAGISLFDMLRAYQKLLERKEKGSLSQKTVTREEYSVEDRMVEILTYIERRNTPCRFDELFTSYDRSHIVVTFLAILELIKTRTIQCKQQGNFSNIFIYPLK